MTHDQEVVGSNTAVSGDFPSYLSLSLSSVSFIRSLVEWNITCLAV